MVLLFHWIIAYCKTTKCIGTLNFTNMNLPFVVINPLIVCLSIAGHLTQGHTGCHKRVCLLLGLILVTSKRSGMLGQREYVALGISMILCSTTDLVLTSVCLPFGASGFKFGSWVDVVTSADDKILCQMRVCQWRLPTFNMVLSQKEMVLNMWFAMARTLFYILFAKPTMAWYQCANRIWSLG